MNSLGEFSTHCRDGDHVTKRVTSRHPAGDNFVMAVTRTGETGMRSYLDTLRTEQVFLPRDLEVVAPEPLTVRHRWVQAPTLPETAADDPVMFCAAIAQIARWTQDLDRTDARIDTNLANFCLAAGRPVLVDMLPPLIPSLRPEPDSLFGELFGALCFDTPIILDALVGYAMRILLRAAGPTAARDLLPVAQIFTSETDDANGFPARWFQARLRLAIRAARRDAELEQVHDFFALTSVLGFRRLDEGGRRLRIDEVARRIQELRI